MYCVDKGGKSNWSGRRGTWQRADSKGFCHGGAGASVSNKKQSKKTKILIHSPLARAILISKFLFDKTKIKVSLSGSFTRFLTHLSYINAHRNDMFFPPCRLYAYEVEKSCEMNESLGAGIAVFQGLSNVALNCKPENTEQTVTVFTVTCGLVIVRLVFLFFLKFFAVFLF